MLNNNLGGPGDDARNLTAIPATANTTQSARIEEQVKNHVNTELQFLHYKVDVDYAQSSGSPKLWYASKLTSAWTAVDKDGADAGATRTATISIPSPEGLKGGSEVDYGDNKKSIDSGAAAKAKHEPTKHVVLNNQGYLRVAVIVQTHFRKTLEDLQVALTSTEKSLGKVSDERDSLQQRFDELSDQMNETEQLLKETELELKQKAEGLDLLQAENRELHKELGALSLKAAEDQATIERLRARLARARQRNKELEQENERLQLELAERQRSSVPLEELASGRGVQEAVARDLAFREQHAEKLDALGTDDEFARLLDQGRQLLASSRLKVASLKPSGPKQAPQDPDLV
ncbi:hypothetical protein PO768_20355 [Paucibacter sp. XJ19-41]|nr:hypothetical protein [Paucibacter sp. XJ19-41]MDC6169778.1 hypothetical protein [Paucibacter sp. XJ19-41]